MTMNQVWLALVLVVSHTVLVQLERGHTKKTGNRNFREILSGRVDHMLLNGAAQIEERATQFPYLRCSIQ
jgi:hypothetical protein